MEPAFTLSIPATTGAGLSFSLQPGMVLYVLGANGAGKSSLISHLFNQHHAHSKRISAHRQTWFESNTLDMTPRGRDDLERNTRANDTQPFSRYREWNPAARASLAIYALIDAEIAQAREIADRVRADDLSAAKVLARARSPLAVINDLMRLSNVPIDIKVEEGQRVVASKGGGAPYSVAELSDGERNAFLIAAEVLTAKRGSLILIDEPERHLHRSIASPLLRLLFEQRQDCAFVVCTHEVMLPIDTPQSSTLLVRGCEYVGQSARAWSVDLLQTGSEVDSDVRREILGGRRKMIFVEGTGASLDAPLYSVLFPEASIIPKEACRDVENAVRGLRAAADMHWLSVWGIVDNDQRTDADVERLRKAGVWALSHYSVEALYYRRSLLERIAARQADVTGDVAKDLVSAAVERAVAAVKSARDHFVGNAVLRGARMRLMSRLPTRATEISDDELLKVEVDVGALRAEEAQRFDRLVLDSDWDGLLVRYPVRESGAFSGIVDGLKVKNTSTYRSAVLKLLQEDSATLESVRDLFRGLYAEVSTT